MQVILYLLRHKVFEALHFSNIMLQLSFQIFNLSFANFQLVSCLSAVTGDAAKIVLQPPENHHKIEFILLTNFKHLLILYQGRFF